MHELKDLVGKKVHSVQANSDFMRFVTDQGNVDYEVTGDCCSSSYFFDFFGLDNLIKNGPVKEVKDVALEPAVLITKQEFNDGEIKVYGFQITTESPEYGEVTSVFSFRNSSNGYYGGSIERTDNAPTELPLLTRDGEIK